MVVDKAGYRLNVGIIIANRDNRVFWGRRQGHDAWQFPQGGLATGENAVQAMFRELTEEVGLEKADVEILGSTKRWLKYRLPKQFIRHGTEPLVVGQKQKWFLLKLRCPDEDVDLSKTNHPEFDDWRWVSYWYPVRQVVSFKRDVYRRVMKEFAPHAMPFHKKDQGWRNRR